MARTDANTAPTYMGTIAYYVHISAGRRKDSVPEVLLYSHPVDGPQITNISRFCKVTARLVEENEWKAQDNTHVAPNIFSM